MEIETIRVKSPPPCPICGGHNVYDRELTTKRTSAPSGIVREDTTVLRKEWYCTVCKKAWPKDD
jgi:hypothetical protein